MMNKLKIIIVFALLITSSASFAQKKEGLIDTALTVFLENFEVSNTTGTFKFDIDLERTSKMWHLWENATFQMEFYINDVEIDYRNYDIEISTAGSDIITGYGAAPLYQVYAKILNDNVNKANSRVKMVVLGPNVAVYSKQLNENSTLKLCTVILRRKSPAYPVPTEVRWKMPFEYYQATAYKFVYDVDMIPEYAIVEGDKSYYPEGDENNVEIGWQTKYVTRPTPMPNMILTDFEVEYTGNLNSVCRWKTKSELNNLGFVIKRGTVDRLYPEDEYETLNDSIFSVTVGDYRLSEFESRMKGSMYSFVEKQYTPIPDKLEHRMVNYVYRLYYHPAEVNGDTNTEQSLVQLATRNLVVPNGVITMATASPNPCNGQSSIDYVVDDDVYLTCEVFDQNGNSVKKLHDRANGLLDRKYISRGKYTADFIAPEIASQGLYTVQFIAYPVNDPTVELSRALIKLQLIRGYSGEE